MTTFPDLYSVAARFHVLLVTGPALLLFAAILGWARLQPQWVSLRTKSGLFLVLILALVGLALTVGVYSVVVPTVVWRNRVSRSTVVELRVTPIGSEDKDVIGEAIMIRDDASVASGLASLSEAHSWSRQHEAYTAGARIDFRFEGEEDFSDVGLLYFPNSDRRDDVHVVIPFVGEWLAGEYQCDEFGAWYERAVDFPGC